MRALHSHEERAAIVDDFNNPLKDVQVLIYGMRLGSVGFDLHRCCCRGIVFGWPWNANLLLQILGRLVRFGQQRAVEWLIATIDDTIHENHEGIIWRKFTRQMAAESGVSDRIKGELGIIVMYELVRCLFNQPFSRYIMETSDFDVGVFSDPGVVARAHIYSEIARGALAGNEIYLHSAGKNSRELLAAVDKIAHLREKDVSYVPRSKEDFDGLARLQDWDVDNLGFPDRAKKAVAKDVRKRAEEVRLVEAKRLKAEAAAQQKAKDVAERKAKRESKRTPKKTPKKTTTKAPATATTRRKRSALPSTQESPTKRPKKA